MYRPLEKKKRKLEENNNETQRPRSADWYHQKEQTQRKGRRKGEKKDQ